MRYTAHVCGQELVQILQNKTVLSFQIGYGINEETLLIPYGEIMNTTDIACPIDPLTFGLFKDQELSPLDRKTGKNPLSLDLTNQILKFDKSKAIGGSFSILLGA